MSGFDYRKAMPTFWTGKTGRWLRTQPPETSVVALYLFTCPSSTQWGVFYLPVVLICNDTGLDRRASEGALKGLQGHGFAKYDPESEVVWVVNMCRDQVGPLRGKDNRVKAASDAAEEILKMPFGFEWYERYQRDLQLPPKPEAGAGAGAGAETSMRFWRSARACSAGSSRRASRDAAVRLRRGLREVPAEARQARRHGELREAHPHAG